VWKQIGPGLFVHKREGSSRPPGSSPASIAEEIVAVGRLRAVFSTELRAGNQRPHHESFVADGEGVKRDQQILKLDQQESSRNCRSPPATSRAAKLRVETGAPRLRPPARAARTRI